jgi:hypothetical protein
MVVAVLGNQNERGLAVPRSNHPVKRTCRTPALVFPLRLARQSAYLHR